MLKEDIPLDEKSSSTVGKEESGLNGLKITANRPIVNKIVNNNENGSGQN